MWFRCKNTPRMTRCGMQDAWMFPFMKTLKFFFCTHISCLLPFQPCKFYENLPRQILYLKVALYGDISRSSLDSTSIKIHSLALSIIILISIVQSYISFFKGNSTPKVLIWAISGCYLLTSLTPFHNEFIFFHFIQFWSSANFF